MAIDRVDEVQELPYDRPAITAGGQALADYMYVLVRYLAAEQLYELGRRVNAMIDVNSVDYRYYSTPDPNTGLYPDGTWRQGVNDDGQFVTQKYNDGTWETVTVNDA